MGARRRAIVVAVVVGGLVALFVLSRDRDEGLRVQVGRSWAGEDLRAGDRFAAPGNAIAASDVAIWLADATASTVTKLDPGSGRVAVRSTLAFAPLDLAATASAIWVAGDGGLARLDPATALVTDVELPGGVGDPAGPIAAGGGIVWLATSSGIVRYDPAADTASVVAGGESGEVLALAASESAVWTAGAAPLITALGAQTFEARGEVDAGGRRPGLDYGAQALWAVLADEGRLVAFDPVHGSELATVRVQGMPTSVAATRRAVWVLDREASEVVRIALR